MSERIRLIDAILTLADRELAKEEQGLGTLRALLTECLPLLRELRRRDVLLARLRDAEAGSGERSDPASNADMDEEIARLRKEVLS